MIEQRPSQAVPDGVGEPVTAEGTQRKDVHRWSGSTGSSRKRRRCPVLYASKLDVRSKPVVHWHGCFSLVFL